MRPTPIHAKIHIPLIVSAILITTLSYIRFFITGSIGLDTHFPPLPAAEAIGALFIGAVALAGYGYWNAVMRGVELGLSFDRVLRLAKVLGILSLIALPLMSNDIFIYLSCGQAPLMGINPYTDAALLPGTDYHRFVPPIWAEGPYCKYGPAAVSIAQFAVFIGGSAPLAGIFAWKLLVFAAFLLFCDATALLLKRFGTADGPAAPFILLCPILWAQAAGQGHNDIFAALFLVGSLLALAHGRFLLSILLLTLGMQVKFYLLPLFLLFFLAWWQTVGLTRRSAATLALSILCAAGFSVLLHFPYWSGKEMLVAIYGPLVNEQPMNNIAYLLPYGLTTIIPALRPYQTTLETALHFLFTALVAMLALWQLRRLVRKQDAPYLVFVRIMALVICFAALRFHAWYFIALLPLCSAGLPPVWLRWGIIVFPLTLIFDIHNFLPRDSYILMAILPATVILVNLLFFHRLRERLSGLP